jgi:hypothetical protein
VRLGEKDDRIYLAESIPFHIGADGKPQLTMNGNMMAALVARVLAGHEEVATVRIEVHGKDASKEQTQQRGEALRAALVKNGIDAQRLTVLGLGAGPNRVELIIESRYSRPRQPSPAVRPADDSGPAPDSSAAPKGSGSASPGSLPDAEAP